jgi:hypothetical protein
MAKTNTILTWKVTQAAMVCHHLWNFIAVLWFWLSRLGYIGYFGVSNVSVEITSAIFKNFGG